MKSRNLRRGIGLAPIALVLVSLLPSGAAAKLPSAKACPGQKNAKAGKREQESAVRCLVDHVRVDAGAGRVDAHRALERAAAQKADDLANCGFSHTACGRPADAWAQHFGYEDGSGWAWGENIAVGSGRYTAREAVKSWLHSSSHRSTLLRGSFEHVGVGMEREGRRTYWVIEMGCRGC